MGLRCRGSRVPRVSGAVVLGHHGRLVPPCFRQAKHAGEPWQVASAGADSTCPTVTGRESLPVCELARRLRFGLRSAGEAPAATRSGATARRAGGGRTAAETCRRSCRRGPSGDSASTAQGPPWQVASAAADSTCPTAGSKLPVAPRGATQGTPPRAGRYRRLAAASSGADATSPLAAGCYTSPSSSSSASRSLSRFKTRLRAW